MSKFVMGKYQKLKHQKAFEVYSETDAQGNRRSNNAIAQMIGVSASAIAYWKRRDNWDGKLIVNIDEEIKNADLTNRHIKRLLRESLFNHIKSLNRVIEYSKNDTDKVAAIKAFVHVAKELNCLDPDTGGIEPALIPPPQFEDDLPHGPAVETSAGVAGADLPLASPSATDGNQLEAVFESAGV